MKRSPKRASPKRTPQKRGSPKRASPKRGSPKRASPKRGSPKRGSPKRGSPKRWSPTAIAKRERRQAKRLSNPEIVSRQVAFLHKHEPLVPTEKREEADPTFIHEYLLRRSSRKA